MEKTELPPFLFGQGLWDKSENPIWPLSTFILQRNLSSASFPQKMDEAELIKTAAQVQELVLKHVDGGHLLPSETLSPLDKEFLFEHFFCVESFRKCGQGASLHHRSRRKLLGAAQHLRPPPFAMHRQPRDMGAKFWQMLSKLEKAL